MHKYLGWVLVALALATWGCGADEVLDDCLDPDGEIGRASCRERVCLVV